MKTKKVKPIDDNYSQVWVVVEPDGIPLIWSINHKRKDSINEYLCYADYNWQYFQRLGYTCRKFRLVEVNNNDE